jgi:hypothetical protein
MTKNPAFLGLSKIRRTTKQICWLQVLFGALWMQQTCEAGLTGADQKAKARLKFHRHEK